MGSFKEKLALFAARKKYFSRDDSQVNFTSIISKAETYLIVLPDNAEDTLSASDIPKYFSVHKKKVTLVGHEKILPIALESSKYGTISFNDDSATKFGLPNKELIGNIKSKKYDVVLDLNRSQNLFISVLAGSSDSLVKIGFKKEKSDEFYNLQVANNQNNAEISYRNFLNSIQMF